MALGNILLNCLLKQCGIWLPGMEGGVDKFGDLVDTHTLLRVKQLTDTDVLCCAGASSQDLGGPVLGKD